MSDVVRYGGLATYENDINSDDEHSERDEKENGRDGLQSNPVDNIINVKTTVFVLEQ